MRSVALMASSFLLVLGTAASARAGLTSVDIGLNPTYEQTGPSTVTSTGGFFAARAFLGSASDFDRGTLTFPGAGSPLALTASPDPLLGYSTGYATLAALNAAYPFGTYAFSLTNSVTVTTQTATISYTVAADPLSIPELTAASYSGLQTLNPALGFTFDFNTFAQSPAGNLAYVFLNVYDSTGSDVFAQGFLNSSTTSIFMPGGTLTAGKAYTFDLIFDDRISGTDGTTPSTIFFDAHTDGTFIPIAAPEPETWVLMMLGLGGLGATMRRKRSRHSALA